MTDLTIADVMRAYAEDAVAFAKRRFGATLDYSEASLNEIDRILADYTKSGLLVPAELPPSEQEGLWTLCKMLGGYVGEVIIRNIGGTWQMKAIDANSSSVRLIAAGGVEGSPPDAVWRTLTEPCRDMTAYYRGLRAVLGHGEQVVQDGIREVSLPPLSSQPPS